MALKDFTHNTFWLHKIQGIWKDEAASKLKIILVSIKFTLSSGVKVY